MKKLCMILPLALILCFMVGCQDKEAMAELEEFRAQAEVEKQNKEIVRRYFTEIDKGDVEPMFALVDEIFAPDCIAHSATSEVHGIEAMKGHITWALDTFGGMQHNIEEMIAEGNMVSVRFTLQATLKGDFLGVSATGKQLSCPVLYMFRFEEGKIQESWIDWNSLYNIMTTQLGMELKPKEGEK
jgi:predicted ester cyclase